MSSYTGIYTGIVVDSGGKKSSCDVPSGKVLVHIDGITPTNLKSQGYKGLPASNVKGTLDVDSTKKFQVLAKVMMPIVNESSPGLYDANGNTNTPTRAVPANQYKPFVGKANRDASSDQVENVTRKNNPYGASYTSDYRSAGGLGVFAVPAVGTRVRIMFENGNLASPIVIGQVNTSDEFSGVFKSGKVFPTLPFANENVVKDKSSGSNASKDESHAAKGGDTELSADAQRDMDFFNSEKFKNMSDEEFFNSKEFGQALTTLTVENQKSMSTYEKTLGWLPGF